MTTLAVPTPNRAPSPRPRQTPKQSSSADATRPPISSKQSNVRSGSIDPLSDDATASLIRRTLCPQHKVSDDDKPVPLEQLLPSLTSRNDIDLQLYAILAIIMREFVQSWYSKITADESFVAEVLHVIAHCTRGLEQRLRKVDLQSLLLDEIPDLLDKHITAYRTAHLPVVHSPLETNPREIYHSLCPLPALSPVPQIEDAEAGQAQQENEALYRHLLVQGMLAVLLPTEDIENPCLTTLVEQIFSELIVGNVIANKASQPWLLFEVFCILSRPADQRKGPKRRRSSLELSIEATAKGSGWSLQAIMASVVRLGTFLMTIFRFCLLTLTSISSLPARRRSAADEMSEKGSTSHSPGFPSHSYQTDAHPTPVLDFKIWSCLGNALHLSQRMPWLTGLGCLLQYGAIHGPGGIADVDGPLDRILVSHIATTLAPSQLPSILRTLRGLLFPNNAPGSPSLFPPSSDEDLLALRRRASRALWALLPRRLARLYFGYRLWAPEPDDSDGDRRDERRMREDEDEEMIDEVEELLMVFSDEYCNKHLMYGVLELVVLKLVPELADKGITELLDERLG